MEKNKVYVAIPFSGIEEISFKAANEVASELIKLGYIVFSPISHSYGLWKTERIAHAYDVWLEQDRAFVEWCDEICEVCIDYDNHLNIKSKGVQLELSWAKELNKRIFYVDYLTQTNDVIIKNQ